MDLLNRHPDYVTLSSCAGRVALFDPDGDGDGADDRDATDGASERQQKGTERNGKGRGRWILVTHDVLPDLGARIVRALEATGRERRARAGNGPASPVAFKHEPPLIHVAAASLAAGRALLRLAKSTCAMRESGLVVTDQRVTVELRTTGTLLCLSLLVRPGPPLELAPDAAYLCALATLANERMVQNEALIGRLCAAVREELLDGATELSSGDRTATEGRDADGGGGADGYSVALRP